MLKREEHTRGVVLARRASGEGSVRVLFYTEALGMVSAIAKSAREERSQLRPHLLPGTRGTYSFVRGRAEWRVTGAHGCAHTYYETSARVAHECATRVLGVVRQFVHGEGGDEALFSALWELLQSLPGLSADDIRVAEYVAVLRMLAALGYVAQTGVEEFMNAEYSAALLARARSERRALVSRINQGLGASGL